MVASHRNGNPRVGPFIFDICTKSFEMSNTKAVAKDVNDLIQYYNDHHPTLTIFEDRTQRQKNLRMKKKSRSSDRESPSEVTIYELAEFFIQDQIRKEPNSHFVLDEVPIIQQGKYIVLLITHRCYLLDYDCAELNRSLKYPILILFVIL